MRSLPISSIALRRAATATIVATVGLAFVPTYANASTADPAKKATIDTYKSWDGASSVSPFGCPDSTTYGETITIPAGKSKITKFSFYMWGQAGAGQSMKVRGEVYAWSGTGATGSAVAQTKAKTIAFPDGDVHKVTFKTKGAGVEGGQQYVIFASIDKDYESCTGSYEVSWGSTDGTVYPGGDFAFQNNAGQEDNWTGAPWSTIPIDAAMQVYMK